MTQNNLSNLARTHKKVKNTSTKRYETEGMRLKGMTQ